MRISFVPILLALAAAPAAAQTPARVPLGALVDETLARNPEIVAAHRRYDAARVRPTQFEGLPDPMISAGYNASGRPWPGAGLGTEPTSNIGVMVSQSLPSRAIRAVRVSMAEREADAEALQVEATRLRLVSRVSQAYTRLAYTYAVEEVLERNRQLLDTLVTASETRYAAGQIAQADVIKTQAQFGLLALKREQVRQERAMREAELNALRAREPGTPVGRPEDLAWRDDDIALGPILAQADTHAPMLRREAVMVNRSQIAVDEARREDRPEVAVTGGYFYMGRMPAMYELRLDVTIPLQRRRRASLLSERLLGVAEARSTYESAKLDLQGRIEQDVLEATTSARLARLYRDTVIPQTRLVLESSLTGFAAGRTDLMTVLMNAAMALEQEMSCLDALAAADTAASRIAEMAGSALAPGVLR